MLDRAAVVNFNLHFSIFMSEFSFQLYSETGIASLQQQCELSSSFPVQHSSMGDDIEQTSESHCSIDFS